MASVARLINCFEVPPGQDDDFLTLFGEINAYMAARPGFLGNRLHRSLAPDARYRYVNYVDWESPAHLRAARDDHFTALRASVLAMGVNSTASVYEIVQERQGPAESVPDDGAPAGSIAATT